MMPCKLCGVLDGEGKPRRGLKQAGRTKRSSVRVSDPAGTFVTTEVKDARGERIYRCQDCGALWRMTFNTVTKTHADEPVLTLIEGEKG